MANLDKAKMFTIEIVEDDAPLRSALHDKLVREGFRVLLAKDGEEGLSAAFSEHPDLILLDIVMPRVDGIMMMKKLREENVWGRNVPIIILTNLSADDEKINQIITDYMPAYYFMKSDWKMSDLIEKINERLARK